MMNVRRLALAVAAVLAVALAACGGSTPPEEEAAPTTLDGRINAVLGESNRDEGPRATVTVEDREVTVVWSINDNMTVNLILVGMRQDAVDILETVATQDGLEYDGVMLAGTYPMADTMGNVEDKHVVEAFYPAGTVADINFEGFMPGNVWVVSDQERFRIHSEFVG